jgi:chromate transporter
VAPIAVMLLTFAAVGLLHWPLIPVVLAMAPVSIGLALARGDSHAG